MGGPPGTIYVIHHTGATRKRRAVVGLRQQLPAQLGQPPPNRPIEDPLAHSDDSSAQDLRIHGERGDHLLPSCRLKASWIARFSRSSGWRASVTPARTRSSF